MIVIIDDRFRIEIDTIGNHTLIEKQISQSGKSKGTERNIYHGYFTNITNALKKYSLLATISTSEKVSIDQFIETYEHVMNNALEVVKKTKFRS